jgi:hypothetical protein
MLAFYNDKKIKTKYVKRVRAHYKADEIIQGFYWENGKGCAVGCTIELDGGDGNWHQRYEDKLGVPRVLARLEDRIFEGLDNGDAKEFPLRFITAINVGADLSMVFPKFLHWALVDPKDGLINIAKREQTIDSIKKVAAALERKINGENVTLAEWREIRDIAWEARRAAAAYADAAADADAAAYAYAAAYADAYAAAYADAAAYAAAYADAAAAARSARFKKMADKLISLLKEAK